MAYESETKGPSTLQRVGSAISGAMGGVKTAFDMKLAYDQAQRAQQELQMRQEQQAVQIKQAKEQMYNYSQNGIGDIYIDAALSDSPEAAIGLQSDRLQHLGQYGGSPINIDDAKTLATNLSKTLKTDLKTYNDNLAIIGNPQTKDDIAQASYQAAKNALQRVRSKTPGSLAPVWGAKMDAIDQFYQKRMQERYNSIDLANKVAAQAGKPEPTQFQKTFDMKSAEAFNAQVEQLPGLQSRAEQLDKALGIADKVFTGPISGLTPVQFAQKVGSDDAQRLEYYLSQEGMQQIMQFAKSAGVRSIDTEQEQQRLMKTLANTKQSPKVIKEALGTMKKALSEGIRLTLEKQQYITDHGNLQGYIPSSVQPSNKELHPDVKKALQGLKF